MTIPSLPTLPAVEWKVKAATAGSYVGGVVALALLQALSDGSFLAYVPAPYSTLLAPLLPALVTFLAGYITAHTPRSSGLGVDIDQKINAGVAEVVADLASSGRLTVDPATNVVRIEGEVQR